MTLACLAVFILLNEEFVGRFYEFSEEFSEKVKLIELVFYGIDCTSDGDKLLWEKVYGWPKPMKVNSEVHSKQDSNNQT